MRRRRITLLAVAIAVLAVAGVVAAVTYDDDGADQPEAWDPRVRDLVSFVEEERGLRFDHPVRVDFLADDAFRDEVTGGEALDDDDRAQLESIEAILRAVGIVHGDIDLEAVGDELVGDGVVGLYRFEDERVIVRGDTLDDDRRSTLVHELTHALQDQHFDLGEREPDDSGAEAALTAVVEADAEAVQEAWRETLSAERRAALDSAEQSTADDADFEGVPEVFVELMSFPYIFGPDFLDAVVTARGDGARNELLRDPPTTEEHIVVPATYLDEQRASDVATPALFAGETAIDDTEGDFGMLSLLVVLAERVPWVEAWDAVRGWAGDATIAFRRGGDTCVRTDVVFDDGAGAGAFAAAFDRWAEGLPARVRRTQSKVRFESCDPGTSTTSPSGDHVSGITGLVLRRSISQEFERLGVPADAAGCIADGILRRLGAQRVAQLDEQLSNTPDDAAAREVEAAAREAAASCRRP